MTGVSERARIAGFDLVELYPPADIDGMSALTLARICRQHDQLDRSADVKKSLA